MELIPLTDRQVSSVDHQAFGWISSLRSTLRRHYFSIFAFSIFGLGLSLAYLYIAAPRFVATSTLLVNARLANPFHQQSQIDPMSESTEVDSRVQVLKSSTLAEQVARELNLQTNTQFNEPSAATIAKNFIYSYYKAILDIIPIYIKLDLKPENTNSIIINPELDKLNTTNALMGSTIVRRLGQSSIIEISVTTSNGRLSADIANQIAKDYMDNELKANVQVTNDASGWLHNRLDELRQSIMDADKQIQAKRASDNIIDTERGPIDQHQLADLSSSLSAAQNQVTDARERLARVTRLQGMAAIGSPNADLARNLLITKLRQQQVDLQQKLSEVQVTYGSQYSVVVALQKQLSEVQKAINSEVLRLSAAYQADLDIARENEQALRDRLVSLSAESERKNADRRELSTLESQAKTYRDLYNRFLQRYSEAAQDMSFPVSAIRVISPAIDPIVKTSPNSSHTLLEGLIGGFLFGSVASYFHDISRRRIRTAKEVRVAIGYDCIAVLPHIDGRSLPRMRGALPRRKILLSSDVKQDELQFKDARLTLSLRNPHSRYTESLRRVWAKVLAARQSGRKIQVVGCVSINQGEGKSTVAANLAQLFAKAGEKCLLVDGDLRKHSLSSAISSRFSFGFVEMIEDTDMMENMMQIAWQTGLHFLPSSTQGNAPHLSDVWNSLRLPQLMNELRSNFTTIFIDLPPLSFVVDAVLIGKFVDSYILVVESDSISSSVLSDSLRESGIDQSLILGVVLNKVTTNNEGDYRSSYYNSME